MCQHPTGSSKPSNSRHSGTQAHQLSLPSSYSAGSYACEEPATRILGRIAKTSSRQLKFNANQELTSNALAPKDLSELPSKSGSFDLLRVARRMLFEHAKAVGGKEAFPDHRTASCWYCSTANRRLGQRPGLIRATSGKGKAIGAIKAQHIAQCGSVWSCPVCARKIEQHRRQEITTGFDYFYKNHKDKQAALITFTFPHGFDDGCKELRKRQAHAFKLFRGGDAWQRFKNVFGFEGLIRGLEVTFSFKNGWHPHTHEVWFMDREDLVERERLVAFINNKYRFRKDRQRRDEMLEILNKNGVMAAFKAMITERWINACISAGLATEADVTNMLEYAIDVKANARTGDYLAKQDGSRARWGADTEVASSKSKTMAVKGGVERFHPFDFLVKFQEDGDSKWRKLFVDYSMAFKGARHVYWSTGLKKRCGIGEITDEEVVDDGDESGVVIHQVEIHDFKRFRSDPRLVISAFDSETTLTFNSKRSGIELPTSSELQKTIDDLISEIPERRWCDSQIEFTAEDEDKWKIEHLAKRRERELAKLRNQRVTPHL